MFRLDELGTERTGFITGEKDRPASVLGET
jgi:hypothetical protein